MGTDLDDPNAVNSFLEVIGATLIGNTVQADTQSKVKADLSVTDHQDTLSQNEDHATFETLNRGTDALTSVSNSTQALPSTNIYDSLSVHSLHSEDNETADQDSKEIRLGLNASKFAHNYQPRRDHIGYENPVSSNVNGSSWNDFSTSQFKPKATTTATQLKLLSQKNGFVDACNAKAREHLPEHVYSHLVDNDCATQIGLPRNPHQPVNQVQSPTKMSLSSQQDIANGNHEDRQQVSPSQVMSAPLKKTLSTTITEHQDICGLQGTNPSEHMESRDKWNFKPATEAPSESKIQLDSAGSFNASLQNNIRKIIFHGLPKETDYTLVQSLIHAGAIEKLDIINAQSSTTEAEVFFVSPGHCQSYYEQHKDGIEFHYHGKEYRIEIERGQHPDELPDFISGAIACGATRVLHLSNVGYGFDLNIVIERAKDRVEIIIDTYRGGARSIVCRFADIVSAVKLKMFLSQIDTSMRFSVQFQEDPCVRSRGIHAE